MIHALHRPMQVGLLAILVLLVAPVAPVHANSQTLVFNDFCTGPIQNLPASYTAGPLQLQNTAVSVSTPSGVPRFSEANAYQYSLSITSGGTTIALPAQSCPVNRTYEVSNAPGGPSTGSTVPEDQVDPDAVPGLLEQLFRGANDLIEQNLGPRPVEVPCPDAYTCSGGIRGRLFLRDGKELSEASPAYFAFQPAAPLTGPILIPFIVEAPGIGDSLSMYFGATQFFKQPLDSFTIGQLYFASLPLPAGPASNAAITLWLDSAGTNGAKVYFPTEAQVVPAPPALALLLTAVGGLCAVRFRPRRPA
jgi:hypothetical protein